jgi:NAD+ synthase (glutamine-hydrolysing)
MKIGLAQINTVVGDLAGNSKLISDAYQRLVHAGAEIVVFPELTVCGYPPHDLLFKKTFIQECLSTAEQLASQATIPLIFGVPIKNENPKGNRLYNGAFVCQNGQVTAKVKKRLLPTYDVFDEKRYFESGTETACIEIDGKKVGITICEDIWVDGDETGLYDVDPIKELIHQKPDLLINLSASPWHVRKINSRLKYLRNTSLRLNCPTVYCNAVGGNDELIFDGNSKVVSSDGQCRVILKGFKSDEAVVDLGKLADLPGINHAEEGLSNIHRALILGLRDYTHKTGFKKAVIGLSGGIDSAVTAAIAVEALGRENVMGVSLPSSISSEHSRDDAQQLARNLGIEYHSVPIADIVKSVESTLQPLFAGLPIDVTEENIQARSRGIVLMALSNKFGSILLTTGNKSEMAVGYCTLYGDMAGGLAVLSDVLKTVVYDLAKYINRDQEIIPESTITKPPSAELRSDQKDEDSLPPYPLLDTILRKYIEEGMTRADIIQDGYDSEIVQDIARKVDRNEYKRKQAPPGLKITSLAFGIGRRIPIVQKYVG